ncbi:MAG TPA: hypothetical protein VII99_14880 [Bacteroidia bacterium]
MKSYILFFTFCFLSSISFGQNLVSKKGETFLPDSGDLAISFDATPFLNYAGNLFTGKNNAPTAAFVNPTTMTITGKMFINQKTAYRATVRAGFSSAKESAFLPDAAATTQPVFPNPVNIREDVHKTTKANIGLGFGKEWRKGKTRLQGLYGVEGMVWLHSETHKYEYGNLLSSSVAVDTTTPTTHNFGANITKDEYGNTARILKDNMGTTFGLGARGFVGAEYFIIPKISLSAEYGFGVGIAITGARTQSIESVAGSPATVGNQTIKSGKKSSFGMDNDINGGTGSGTAQLRITFHF